MGSVCSVSGWPHFLELVGKFCKLICNDLLVLDKELKLSLAG